MIWLLPMYFIAMIAWLVKTPLSWTTDKVPVALYDAFDFVARIARSLDGLFPASTFLQEIYVILLVFIVLITLRVATYVWSFVPSVNPRQFKENK